MERITFVLREKNKHPHPIQYTCGQCKEKIFYGYVIQLDIPHTPDKFNYAYICDKCLREARRIEKLAKQFKRKNKKQLKANFQELLKYE